MDLVYYVYHLDFTSVLETTVKQDTSVDKNYSLHFNLQQKTEETSFIKVIFLTLFKYTLENLFYYYLVSKLC